MLKQIINTIQLAVLHTLTLIVPAAALVIGYTVANYLNPENRNFLMIMFVVIIIALKDRK